ncbi:aspartyl-tRNA(Asn)/glutamyl-tRNA(Gln) amidotransferase subunit C [Bacilli bacterium PM5-3]|nr:aspartyl-tRNA(Asn)/glutamyl-tRNA(Gln) amidotransferase subunit C [Bacilli bacterium PM5-3]MDH6603048.1 aspartyl-tRNA(Asn)/glutamyl-tRNA(Gln) amidotransferase subunit C [Bacilli bacterium PM5-9]
MKLVEIMSKEEIQKLLKEIYYEASDEDFEYILPQFTDITQSINYFSEVDVEDLEPADWPFDLSSTYLREDVVSKTLTNEEVLQNAPETQDGYVKYIKVV